MDCPLCSKKIYGAIGALSEAEFYTHINNPRECSDAFPVCPVCGISFAKYAGSRPWRRFARHWMQHGHLSPEEHITLALMGEEPSLQDIVSKYGDFGDLFP